MLDCARAGQWHHLLPQRSRRDRGGRRSQIANHLPMPVPRRSFLRSTALGAAALSAAPFIRAQQPGKKFRTALIGSGWWGKNILKEAAASGRCQFVALADVDATTLEVAAD